MKKLSLIACAIGALSLGGCAGFPANLENAWNTVTSASVPATSVVVSVNTFDALEATATNYLQLPLCKSGGPTVCRSAAATAQIIPAVRAGRVARNNLESFLTANPGKLGPSGLYNALAAAVSTLQGVMAQYGVEG